LTARLSFKYYIIAFLFCFIVVLGWYCIVFLNTNEILMEDDTPLQLVGAVRKLLFALIMTYTFME